jgi:hypothetical protein
MCWPLADRAVLLRACELRCKFACEYVGICTCWHPHRFPVSYAVSDGRGVVRVLRCGICCGIEFLDSRNTRHVKVNVEPYAHRIGGWRS